MEKEKPKSCKECGFGRALSGQANCCGYLLIGGETEFIQEDGFIRESICPVGHWKKESI